MFSLFLFICLPFIFFHHLCTGWYACTSSSKGGGKTDNSESLNKTNVIKRPKQPSVEMYTTEEPGITNSLYVRLV